MHMKCRTTALLLVASWTLLALDEAIKRKFLSDVHQALVLKSGSVVADVGTGDDPLHPLAIAAVVGRTGRVVCVDIDQTALDKLKKNFSMEAMNVETQLGKVDDPMLSPASFDSVLISNAYHEMTEHEAMLLHIRQALKPNGRLVIIELFDENRRQQPREQQTKKHEFPPELLDAELQAAGFEIVSRVEPLLRDGSEIKYLIAARPRGSR